MNSIPSRRRTQTLHVVHEHYNPLTDTLNDDDDDVERGISVSYSTGDDHRGSRPWNSPSSLRRPVRASSSTERPSNHKRLRHLVSAIKRRFGITKECRSRSKAFHRIESLFSGSYKLFSSSLDEPSQEFDWPDFEQIYDTIPICLAKALPGLDDISADDEGDDDDDRSVDALDVHLDDVTDDAIDHTNIFGECQRGRFFHRNGLCQKLDKSLYQGQLGTFIQQLMIEKLIRTWT